MHVAQEQAPPQSASIPTTMSLTAPSMIDRPSAISTACSWPPGSSKMIFAITLFLKPNFLHGHLLVTQFCRIDACPLGDELLGHHEFRSAVYRIGGDQCTPPPEQDGKRAHAPRNS